MELTFEVWPSKGNERVLDFGCGGGLATICLAKSLNKGGVVLGIDISDYWVRIAAKRLKRFSNAECRTGDIVNMEIPEHSFDAIVTIHVLHHVVSEERLLTITKLRNLLKPAGRLMVRERVQVSHGLPPDKLCSVLSEAGFNEVSHSVSGSDFHGVFVTE